MTTRSNPASDAECPRCTGSNTFLIPKVQPGQRYAGGCYDCAALFWWPITTRDPRPVPLLEIPKAE